MAKSPSPGNLTRCMKKECGYMEEWTPQSQGPERCPECDSVMRIRCGSPLRKKPGERCFQFVKPGRRCKRLHGGNSLKGPASPSWTTGEHSVYVPSRYRDAYGRAVADPIAQRGMQRQLALFDAMQDEALHRLDTGESGEAWDRLKRTGKRIEAKLRGIRRATAQGDTEKTAAGAAGLLALVEEELLPVIKRGVGEESARRELQEMWIKRARLIRVQQQGEKTVPVETLGALQAAFANIMVKYIQDRRTLSLLVGELRDLTLPGVRSGPGAAADKAIREAIPVQGKPTEAPSSATPDG